MYRSSCPDPLIGYSSRMEDQILTRIPEVYTVRSFVIQPPGAAMRCYVLICLVGCWLCLDSPSLNAQDGKLDSIRREVETSNPPSPPSSEEGHVPRFGRSSDCDDDDDDSLSGKFVFFVLTSPWWGPKLALEGDVTGVTKSSW